MRRRNGRGKVRRGRSVFHELGFSRQEAAKLSAKERLCSQIVRYAKRYSQAELGKILNEPQPRISDLMRGKISKFSLDTLFRYAEKLHMNPEIRLHRPVEEPAAVR